MTRDDLIRGVARRTGVLIEAVDLIVDTFIDEIKAAVERGEQVSLNEFMKINLRAKKATHATHFPTGQRMNVDETKTPWVTVSRTWKREVKKKYRDEKKKS